MRHLDLFSGIGGFALALDQVADASHEFVEYEPHLQRVLSKNWPASKIHGDIRAFIADYSPDLVTGGFPCQDISRANTNKNKGGINGERSGLWTEYFRVLGECRPKYCIIENVYDLLGKGIGRVLRDLACIGYDSAWTVIDSQYTGVPQRRRRVYILGVRDGITEGADIFQCGERSGLPLGKTDFSRKNKKDYGPFDAQGERQFWSIQKTGEYKQSNVCSTIRKCGWANGGDIIVGKFARHLTADEKLRLQGVSPEHTKNCSLNETQRHSANGMTIPAVKWVIERMIDYDKALDI